MKESVVAKSYARAITVLCKESHVDVALNLTDFQKLINSSNDLENVLFLDIFTIGEKKEVLSELLKKLSYPKILTHFLFFIIDNKRISLLPLIYKEIMVMDDHEKGFLRVNVEGVEDEMDQKSMEKVIAYLKIKLQKEPLLDYKKSSHVTAGYKITADDLQLDATIDYQFSQLKNSILGDE